jgi:predicted NAD/FAD-dependent oxidoreductase
MDEKDTPDNLEEENRILRRRVLEFEEIIAGQKASPGEQAGPAEDRDDVPRLLKLLGQKDRILEAYVTELERKSDKIRAMVEDLRRSHESLAASASAQRLLEVLLEGAVAGAFLLVDSGSRVAHASASARELLGDVLPAAPLPDAMPLLNRLDSRLADDLRSALEGTAGAPRAVVIGGAVRLASVAPLPGGGAVEGALIRFAERP